VANFVLSYPPLSAQWAKVQAVSASEEQSSAILASNPSWKVVLGATVVCAVIVKQAAQRAVAMQEQPVPANLNSLFAMVESSMTLTAREVKDVEDVIAGMRRREERDEAEAEGAVTVADSSHLVAGSTIASYMRGLEAIDVCCQMLSRNDISLLLAAARSDSAVAPFLVSFQRQWDQVVRGLSASKAKVVADAGDSLQMLLTAFERTLRLAKGLVSLLEGGATSKSD